MISLFALQADRRIDGDAVQPGEKQRVTLEPLQRLVGIQEGILHHVLGVFGVVDQPIDRMEQTILIAADQLPEGGRIAAQAPAIRRWSSASRVPYRCWTKAARRKFQENGRSHFSPPRREGEGF